MIEFKKILKERYFGSETHAGTFRDTSEDADEYYDDDKVLNATADENFICLSTHEDHDLIARKYTKEARKYPFLYCKLDDSGDGYIEIYGSDSNGWGEELTKIYP